MSIIEIVCVHSIIFWLMAILLSVYYGIRGWVFQTMSKEKDQQPRWKIIFVRYVQDAIYNFICSMAGFVALYLLIKAYYTLNNWHDIGVGSATYLVFLALLAILGTSGVLPRMFGRGSLLGK